MDDQTFFQKVLNKELGECQIVKSSFVGGGCINNTLKFETDKGPFFLKWNKNQRDLFEKEALGLAVLERKSPLRIPTIIGKGQIDDQDYLLLEFLDRSPQKESFWEDFGVGLAEQHRQSADQFGLDHNNHIGRLAQLNDWRSSWIDFFIELRLEPQLQMAEKSGLVDSQIRSLFENFYPQLSSLLPDEKPALLHGDLWSGNFSIGPEGEPCIFDPAVYYGHREMELSFTHMFGGFEAAFYTSYNEAFSLENAFEERIDIYNLYPLLVHVNLFGSSYLPPILRTLNRFK